jgi:hypothetical protein
MRFSPRAAAIFAPSSGMPCVLPPGESRSSTMVPTCGLAIAASNCAPSCSVDVPPEYSANSDARCVSVP